MIYDLIHGANAPDVVSLVIRVPIGTFFAISGVHKALNPARRAALASTFKDDGVQAPFMMTMVPAGELLGGIAFATGTLTVLAAFGLVALCMGACLLDGLKRIRAWKPLDRWDWLDDVLYLPEVLYLLSLVVVIVMGPGKWSVDAVALSYLHGG